MEKERAGEETEKGNTTTGSKDLAAETDARGHQIAEADMTDTENLE